MASPAPELVLNAEHYSRVLRDILPTTKEFLWIATADLKDVFVEGGPKSRPFRPLVAVFAELVSRGVAVRLLHAKEPGPRFRADFDKHAALRESDLLAFQMAIEQAQPGIREDFRHGRFVGVNDWRREHIWSQASRWSTPELLERATGEKLNARHFAEHLERRYLG